jgi:aminopeptidase N
MTYEDCMPQRDIGMLCYFKPAYGLYLLREYILGRDRFDFAFRNYVNRWAFKHPTPKDFFKSMNDATGDNLNWFWREWFYKSSTLDQSVSSVKYSSGDTANGTKGAEITILNNRQMVMPVFIEVKESNGHTGRVTLPVEIWQNGGKWTFHYNSTSTIQSVTIDPDKVLPDMDRSNNTWPAKTN